MAVKLSLHESLELEFRMGQCFIRKYKNVFGHPLLSPASVRAIITFVLVEGSCYMQVIMGA